MQKKRFYIVGIFLLITNLIHAQNGLKIWDKRFGGFFDESFHKIIATADGGYLLGGDSYSGANGDKTQTSQGSYDYWVVKIDVNGNKVWDKRFGGTGSDNFQSVIATADGGYLLGGYSYSGADGDKTQPSLGLSDYWVVKIDANGNKVWDKRFGGTDSESLNSIIATVDGGYLLVGSSNSDANGDKTQPSQGGSDYWIVKIDISGNQVWDKCFGGTGSDNFQSVIATSDGGYLLGGESYSEANGDKTQPSQGGSDYWIVKIDMSGNKVWDKRFGGNDIDNLSCMLATTDGGYMLGGYSKSDANGDKTQPSIGFIDYWIVKIDVSGNKAWDKRFGGTSGEAMRSMISTADGGYLLGGYAGLGANGDITQPNQGFIDYWVLKIDVNGNKLWDKRFGGSDIDDLKTMIATPDGGYLLGGESTSGANGDKTQQSQGGFDYWVVKISGECTLSTASITPSTYQNTCAGRNLTFAGASTGGTSPTYVWSSSPTGFSSSLQNPSFTTPMVTQTTNYVLTLTVTDAGCPKTATTMVTVNNIPNPPNILTCSTTPKTEWMKKFGGSNYESLNKVLELTDGSLLWIGGSRSQTSGDKSMDNFGSDDTWVIKTDATGNTIIWQKGYGGSAMEYDAAGVATPDGGAIIGITSRSVEDGNKTTTNFGDADIWVIKIDANGNIIRQWVFGGDSEDRLSNIIATSDGNYLITSLSYSAGETGNKSDNGAQLRDNRQGDYWVIKFNPNSSDPIGAFIWQRSYGGNGTDYPIEALETSSGDYIVAGWSRSDGGTGSPSNKTAVNFDGNAGLSDYWVLKIKGDGTQILWQQSYGGAKAAYNPSGQDYGDDYLYSLTKSNINGRYVIGGYSKSESSTGNKLTPLRGNFDGWIVEINDADGSKVGERTIGGANQDIFGKIVDMPNGNGYWVTMKVTNTNSGDITDTPLGMSDIWLAEIDNNLTNFNSITPRWNRRLGGSLGAYDDIPNNVTLTKSGDLIISGVRASDATNTNGQSQDYFVVKISECSASTNTSICPSTGITLYASGCSGTINWSNGMTGNNISVNTVGTYTATCTANAANCPSISSNSIVVSTIPASLTLNSTATSGIQKATRTITSDQTIQTGTNVTYQAGNSVNLQGTFNAQTGSVFKAEIKGCSN